MDERKVTLTLASLDAAIATLMAQRALLAEVLAPPKFPEPMVNEDNDCRHTEAALLETMGGGDSQWMCPACGEVWEGGRDDGP